MGDIKEVVKTAFNENTFFTLVGGTVGMLGVLAISNALQDAPNLFSGGGE